MTLWPFSNCISIYSDYKKEEEILHKSEQENPKNTYHSFKKKFYYSLPPFSYTLILTTVSAPIPRRRLIKK